MPIPLIIGAAVVLGGVAHIDASSTNKSAQNMIDEAKDTYEEKKLELDCAKSHMERDLANLGKIKKDVLDTSMKQFIPLFQKVKDIILEDSDGLSELSNISFSDKDIAEIKSLTLAYTSAASSSDVAGAAATSLAALAVTGALPAVAGSLELAGTAVMLGEVGLAADIAIGALAPFAAFAAPALLAFSGFSASAKADENYKAAQKYKSDIDVAVSKLDTQIIMLDAVSERGRMYSELLKELNDMFSQCVDKMEIVVRKCENSYQRVCPQYLSADDRAVLAVCTSLAHAVKSVMDVPLVEKSGSVSEKSGEKYDEMVEKKPRIKKEVEKTLCLAVKEKKPDILSDGYALAQSRAAMLEDFCNHIGEKNYLDTVAMYLLARELPVLLAKDKIKILEKSIPKKKKKEMEYWTRMISQAQFSELGQLKDAIQEVGYTPDMEEEVLQILEKNIPQKKGKEIAYWKTMISGAQFSELGDIEDAINGMNYAPDMSKELLRMVDGRKNALLNFMILEEVDSRRGAPLQELLDFKEGLLSRNLSDVAMNGVTEKLDSYIMAAERSELAEKYADLSSLELNGLQRVREELKMSGYSSSITEQYIKKVDEVEHDRHLEYLDNMVRYISSYTEDELNELYELISKYEIDEASKSKYYQLVSDQIQDIRLQNIRANMQSPSELSLAEIDKLMEDIQQEISDSGHRNSALRELKPWRYWAQKEYMDNLTAMLDNQNREEVLALQEELRQSGIPDFITEFGFERIERRLLLLDEYKINSIVPDFNVLSNEDIRRIRASLSDLEVEEVSRAAFTEKLDKREWYNSLADIREAADRVYNLVGQSDVRNLHIALYSPTYIPILNRYRELNRFPEGAELPVFIIDGGTSLALSKRRLWIYSFEQSIEIELSRIQNIVLNSRFLSSELIIYFTDGMKQSVPALMSGLTKPLVQKMDDFIRELKSGMYSKPSYLREFELSPFKIEIEKPKHDDEVDMDYFVDRFVPRDYCGIAPYTSSNAIKNCRQQKWPGVEQWLKNNLGIPSYHRLIWYVDLSRILNGENGLVIGTEYIYLQRKNLNTIYIMISAITNCECSENVLLIQEEDGNVFRVEFPGRAESVRAFTNALQEYVDGVQMLQARGLASLGDAIENADRSPSVDTVRQGDFTQRLNRFISGFSKNVNTATDWDNSASRGLRRGMETIGDNYRTEQKQSEYDSSAEYSSPMYQLYMEDNERNGFAQPDDIPEKPRFCPNCGKPTDVDGRFCRYCGRKLY